MQHKESKKCFLNKATLRIGAIILVILLAGAMLWQGKENSCQSIGASVIQIYFEGEYRIGDGEWHTITPGEHIPSTKGDVTLRGNFHGTSPGGEYIGLFSRKSPVAFYTDHINLTFHETGFEPYVIDHENSLFGDSACGVDWTAHYFMSASDEPIEIVVHNPHRYGNENAIDEMLENIAIWANIDFEKEQLDKGEEQRNIGLVFVIVAMMFLGTAMFSALIHIKNSRILWILGPIILSAGMYFIYSSDGISFRSESVIFNTSILGISMFFYMLFFSIAVTRVLEKTKKIGIASLYVMGAVDALLFVIPMLTKTAFYDTWLYWAFIQLVISLVLIVCLVIELFGQKVKNRFVCIGLIFPLISFGCDVIMTGIGVWSGGVASKFVFNILFVVSMIVLIMIVPRSINALTKAKELETEKIVLNAQLAESRISTMMSQIRPHFIYNTLGSIEQLCKFDPPKAGELVHNFAKYLRGNFGELDNPKPILMSQEMEHVRYYISIENVRFPDMTFSFEMNSDDFHIPALTIQPIVENAIKHGLMKLPKGGKIRVVSYETDTHHYVLVEDDGVGFDTSVLYDERTHVGIRNIRGRLKAMVNGELEIESTVGVGTKVLITIPKERPNK